MAKSGITAPGDAYKGNLDPMSPEAATRGMDLAMSAPMAGLAAKPVAGLGSNVRAYHGTNRAFDRFALDKADAYERGVFFSDNPELAAQFASPSGGRVIPTDIDLSNSVTVDLRKIAGKEVPYAPSIVSTAINEARKAGKDAVIIKGMRETEFESLDVNLETGTPVRSAGQGDQIIMLEPKGKVKNAITGETMFANPGSASLGGILGLSSEDNQAVLEGRML